MESFIVCIKGIKGIVVIVRNNMSQQSYEYYMQTQNTVEEYLRSNT